jgi:hypothetical protein
MEYRREAAKRKAEDAKREAEKEKLLVMRM